MTATILCWSLKLPHVSSKPLRLWSPRTRAKLTSRTTLTISSRKLKKTTLTTMFPISKMRSIKLRRNFALCKRSANVGAQNLKLVLYSTKPNWSNCIWQRKNLILLPLDNLGLQPSALCDKKEADYSNRSSTKLQPGAHTSDLLSLSWRKTLSASRIRSKTFRTRNRKHPQLRVQTLKQVRFGRTSRKNILLKQTLQHFHLPRTLMNSTQPTQSL